MIAEKRPSREEPAARVCIAVIIGAHGVRGMLRVRSFAENPENVTAYGPVTDETGERVFKLAIEGRGKGDLLVRTPGIADRDAALALKGTLLYVARAALPEPEADEFYHGDLIGLRVEDRDGTDLGRVRGVHNFGAGDILEVGIESGATAMIPFTHQAVPEIDLDAGRVLVDPDACGLSSQAPDPAEPRE